MRGKRAITLKRVEIRETDLHNLDRRPGARSNDTSLDDNGPGTYEGEGETWREKGGRQRKNGCNLETVENRGVRSKGFRISTL